MACRPTLTPFSAFAITRNRNETTSSSDCDGSLSGQPPNLWGHVLPDRGWSGPRHAPDRSHQGGFRDSDHSDAGRLGGGKGAPNFWHLAPGFFGCWRRCPDLDRVFHVAR